MTITYYQRVLLSEKEKSWDSDYGPGIWVEAYRRQDDPRVLHKLFRLYLSGASPSYIIGSDERGLALLDWFLTKLAESPINELLDLVRNSDYVLKESIENTPQLSSYESSTDGIVRLLADSERGMSFEELGYHLNPNGQNASKVARVKYGENCSKFAALLDLVEIDRIKGVSLTSVGKVLSNREDGDVIFPRLLLRSALFRDLVCSSEDAARQRFIATVGSLSESTKVRRASAFSIMYGEFCRAGGMVKNQSEVEDLIWSMRR